MNAQPPSWYLRRLRRMSAQEVGSRAIDRARQRLWSRRRVALGQDAPPPADLRSVRAFTSGLRGLQPDDVPAPLATLVVAAAETVLDGTWTVFGERRSDAADPNWFADPTTRRHAPQDTLAFAINHRDETVTGNIKQVWEMSRHHHLTVLGAAWWLTREERYAEILAAQLRSWWRANPFLSGVHWTSGIELGVRLISWVWVRRLLDEWPKVSDLFEGDDDALRQIAWHCEFLAAFPSRGSSANNHVIAEAAGLVAAANAFDWYGRSAYWRRTGRVLLEREFAANTFSSGLNRELASDYHRFVLELILAAAVEADAGADPLSPSTWQLITTGLDAAASLLDSSGRPPRQGDGDEGRALMLDDPEQSPWGVLLSAGAALTGGAPWWPGGGPSVTGLLLGAVGDHHPGDHLSEPRRWFPDAGCALLVSGVEDGPQIWCRVDGGPHGFTSIAAHAHADALSIELRHDGVELLVDPGTFCYHGEPSWRSWFRSTAAHNTVELGGRDSSDSGGPFMWTRHATTRTLDHHVESGPVQSWTGEHDGYAAGSPSATHRRRVVLDSRDRRLRVEDRLTSSGPVPARLSWHLGPAVEVALYGNHAVLSWQVCGEPRRARMMLPEQLSWSLVRGREDPVEGWYSNGFARREPAFALIGVTTLAGSATWASEVELS